MRTDRPDAGAGQGNKWGIRGAKNSNDSSKEGAKNSNGVADGWRFSELGKHGAGRFDHPAGLLPEGKRGEARRRDPFGMAGIVTGGRVP
jgi:hypothetical protein